DARPPVNPYGRGIVLGQRPHGVFLLVIGNDEKVVYAIGRVDRYLEVVAAFGFAPLGGNDDGAGGKRFSEN
ncbi:MAG: hypothetical protein KDD10_08720, partial [Phaeodactylibacter sp.]|nr:hypothetical protein [Phaeodactylibacter sp.]